ncbi:MAG TPA: aldehyde dehydrogenase (NADP(+)) [Acidobacteriaceae bacterium]|jgi:NADP-dependent aldehyde dehydrogenase|nr:aldehyde dehydrogenase (NADP(+)) [Acidobacteriaceae bacterium]
MGVAELTSTGVLTGEMLIGARGVRGTQGSIRAINPASGEQMEPEFGEGSQREVNEACSLAESAFNPYRTLPLERRAQFLEAIAQGILDLGDVLIERVMAESGLPRPRIEGERGRTVAQLRLFAALAREGRWLNATIDPAMPDRKPLPRSDLRSQKIPLGPVAVFSASNFPLAFSVAGGDTAAAFAAGCPVVAKSHSSHLGTSELVGRVIQKAVKDCGLPEGIFSLLVGGGSTVGEALVKHSAIRAVGFTGSRKVGQGLVAVAAAREVPIPVYAEMSSINPVFLLPGALAERAEKIGQGFIDSLTLGTGQFCTKPGIVIGVAGLDFDRFLAAAQAAIETKTATTMLNPTIHKAYCEGTTHWSSHKLLSAISRGAAAEQGSYAGQPMIFGVAAQDFIDSPELLDEVFGPAALIIECKSIAQLIAIAEHLNGQLTATMHMAPGDITLARQFVPTLERKAGRLLVNGFPTGVEVCYAMVHGGPSPSTSDSRVTSVGAMSIERFLRPVCYQDFPEGLMPEALKDGNPLHLWRLVDGKLQQV